MNERQRRLIQVLEEKEEGIHGKELAKLLRVSSRTIRSDVLTINQHYQQSIILSCKQYGYRRNKEILLNFMETSKIPQTVKERSTYLLKLLLLSEKEISFLELEKKLFIAETSLRNELKGIRQQLEKYSSLRVQSKNHYLKLLGKEEEKRKLYKELLKSEIKDNFINLDQIAELYTNFDLLEIKSIMDAIVKEQGYSLHALETPMMMLHLGISLERMLKGNYYQAGMDTIKEIENMEEYRIAEAYYKKIGFKYCLEIPKGEVRLMAMMLLGKRSSLFYNDAIKENNTFLEGIIIEMLGEIETAFGIDFSQDQQLIDSLTAHVYTLLQRKKVQASLQNPLLRKIKENYPLIFDSGVRSVRFLEMKLGLSLDEHEVSLIALHLGASYDRRKDKEIYRGVLVFPGNQALLNQLMTKINYYFEERLQLVAGMTYIQEELLSEKIDLIIAVSEMNYRGRLRLLTISPFFDYNDQRKTSQELDELDRLKFKESLEEEVLQLMDPTYFLCQKEFKTKEEVIDTVCKKLLDDGIVQEGYRESLLKREELSSTSFAYFFATPHALHEFVKISKLPIVLLQKPIQWGEHKVKMIIFLVIRKEDHHLTKAFFEWLGFKLTNTEEVLVLSNSSSYDAYIEQIRTR